MKLKALAQIGAALCSLITSLNVVFAQGTAFTYQGQLKDGINPAQGSYDLQFSVYDASVGGNLIAGPLGYSGVAVSNGVFTVTLDFGGIFGGGSQWLEIGVRTNGAAAFTTLVPRQQFTAVPYAITAGNLNGTVAASQLTGNLPASQLSGTIALAQLPAVVLTNGAAGVILNGSFAGNGANLTNLNSASLTGPLTVTFGTPVSLGNVYDGGTANGVAVSGNYAYLANGFDGLRIYDISNPTNPVSTGHAFDDGVANGVVISGNCAYLANGYDGLRVYLVLDPSNPISIGEIYDGWGANGVAVAGNFAYLANGADGLRIYNVANPSYPMSIAHALDGGTANGVAVSGNYAYLANDTDGLRVYYIANPANPVSVGHNFIAGAANAVAVSGNYAYLANGADGLRIYDITNPTNPVPVGHAFDGGTANGVTVTGHYACLANGSDGLRVYDIGNPAKPVCIGHSDNGGAANAVAVSGYYASLADGTNGLRVYSLAVATAAGFQGNGSLLTALDANHIASGTLADERLSTNAALRNADQTFTGVNVFGNVAGGDWLAIKDGSLLLPPPTDLYSGGQILFGVPYDSLFHGGPLNYNSGLFATDTGLLVRSSDIAVEPDWTGLNGGIIRLGNDGMFGDRIFLANEPSRSFSAYDIEGNSNAVLFSWSKALAFNVSLSDPTPAAGGVHYTMYQAFPGIQGWIDLSANTNLLYNTQVAGGKVGLGGLLFYSGVPMPDAYGYQYWDVARAKTLTGRMLTNGWDLRGRWIQERLKGVVNTSNYTLDFNSAYCLDLTLNTSPVAFSVANLYGGTTNLETRVILLHSGLADCQVSFPGWLVASESGAGTAPTHVPPQTLLRIHLESLDTNCLASFQWATEPFIWDRDATNFFSQAGTLSQIQSNAVNAFVRDLKLAGLWSNFDLIYPFVGGNAQAHSVNLKGSGYNIVWHGATTHDAYGVTGNGATSYGDTGFNPSVASGNYSVNSASMVIYCGTDNPNSYGCLLGASAGNSASLFKNYSACPDFTGFNNTNFDGDYYGIDGFHGFIAGSRTVSTNMVLYVRDETTYTSPDTNAAVAVPNLNFYILAANNNPNPVSFTTANLRLVMLGAGLSFSQVQSLRPIVGNFEARLSRDYP